MIALLVGLGLALAGPPAVATTVYKTVDEKGRVSFSDQPPPAGAPVEVLDYNMPTVTPSAMDTARLEAMRETTDRMAADRREREEHRAKLRADARAAQAAANPAPAYEDYYYPYRVVRRGVYYPGIGRPPHLKPRPPVVRPPLARPPAIRPPGAGQSPIKPPGAMQPILPSYQTPYSTPRRQVVSRYHQHRLAPYRR